MLRAGQANRGQVDTHGDWGWHRGSAWQPRRSSCDFDVKARSEPARSRSQLEEALFDSSAEPRGPISAAVSRVPGPRWKLELRQPGSYSGGARMQDDTSAAEARAELTAHSTVFDAERNSSAPFATAVCPTSASSVVRRYIEEFKSQPKFLVFPRQFA